MAGAWLLLVLLGQPSVEAAGDLDGDGKNETLRIERSGDEGPCELVVGAARAKIPGEWEEGCTVEVVDLDATDKKREVLVVGSSASDYRAMVFFRFDGKGLKALGTITGTLPSSPEIGGAGFVVVPIWAGFFNQRQKWVLEKDKLVELTPELYAVDIKAKVKSGFAITTHRGSKEVLARPKVGSEIDVIAYDPSPKCKSDGGVEPCDLFLVRAASGLLGWVTFASLVESTELPWAG